MTDRTAYEIIVPPELERAWGSQPTRDFERLEARLRGAAEAAIASPIAWPAGPAGVNRGKHRAIVDELWLLYRLNDHAQTVSLIGFGRAR